VQRSLCSLLRKDQSVQILKQHTRRLDHIRCIARICAAGAVSSSAMAAEILQKKYRLILVSDLDWTMVRRASAYAQHMQHHACSQQTSSQLVAGLRYLSSSVAHVLPCNVCAGGSR
jgi:DNA-binding transcriptional regulator YdaS (Cro superfamily)